MLVGGPRGREKGQGLTLVSGRAGRAVIMLVGGPGVEKGRGTHLCIGRGGWLGSDNARQRSQGLREHQGLTFGSGGL